MEILIPTQTHTTSFGGFCFDSGLKSLKRYKLATTPSVIWVTNIEIGEQGIIYHPFLLQLIRAKRHLLFEYGTSESDNNLWGKENKHHFI